MLRTHDIDRSAKACLSACLANVLYLASANHTYHARTPHKTLLKIIEIINIESAKGKGKLCVRISIINYQESLAVQLELLQFVVAVAGCFSVTILIFALNINLGALVTL